MSYELVYKEGQDPVEVTLPEARAAALRLVGEDVKHEGTTYGVKEAIFDPTRGIVVTTIAGRTFVLVRLKGAPKKTPLPHVGAKEKKSESRGPGKRLKCECGECKTCRNREWARKQKAETPNPRVALRRMVEKRSRRRSLIRQRTPSRSASRKRKSGREW